MRFSLGATVSQVATVIGVAARGISYLKDNLKVYFDFKSSRAKTLEFVGTGSHYFTSNDYITTTYSLGTASGFTFAFWMQDSALTQGDNYMDNRDSASDGVTFFGSSTNEMTLRINGNDVESSNDLTTGWNHIVGTYDGVIKTIYVNGKATSNAETSSINVAGNLRIGARSYSISNYVTGYMKNCAVWERALSASEVQNIMYKTYSDLKGTETTHLKAWWSMDSQVGIDGNAGSGYVLDEVSGAGSTTNLGTVSGATLKSGIYAGYSPRKPRGFDNAPTAQADLIGSGSTVIGGNTSDDFILVSEAFTGTDMSGAFTATAWVKLNYFTYETIWGDPGDLDSGKDDFFQLINSTTWRAEVGGTATGSITHGETLVTNRWYHFAWTRNASYVMTLYIDGKPTLNGPTTAGTFQPDGWGAGSDGSGGTETELDGNICQAGFWSRQLSQEEIQSIKEKTYSEFTSGEKASILGYWGLDSTAGLNDEVNSNNATLHNGAALSEYNNTAANFNRAPQKTGEPLDHAKLYSGKALEFDGVADYLNSSVPEFSYANEFTVSCWFKTSATTGGDNQWHPIVIGKAGTSATRFILGFHQNGGTKYFKWMIYNTTAYIKFEIAENYNDGQWHRVVATNTNSTLALYVDGVSLTNLGVDASATVAPTSGEMHIGKNSTYYFNGHLCDLQLWDKKWELSDVTYDYLNPETLITGNASVTSGITTSNLLSWYPMNDTGVRSPQTVVFDAAGTNNTTKNHATTTFHGDELFSGDNSTFTDGVGDWTAYSGWSTAIDHTTNDDKLTIGHGGTTNASLAQISLSTVAGRQYTVTYDYTQSDGGIQFLVGTSGYSGVFHTATTITGTSGTLAYNTETFTAQGSTSYLMFKHLTTTTAITIDNFNVKEVGIATGWTDANQQQTIPQTALMDGSVKSFVGNGLYSNSIPSLSYPFTLSCWLYKTDDAAYGVYLVDKDASNIYFGIALGADDKVYLQASNTSNKNTNSNSTYTNQWVHVVASFESATDRNLYINGSPNTDNENNDSVTYENIDRISVGYMGDSSPTYSGSEIIVDEVCVFSTGLNNSEALELYNSGLPLNATKHSQASNLVGYWKNNDLHTDGKWKDQISTNHLTANDTPSTIFFPEGITANLDTQGFNTNIDHTGSKGAAWFDGVSNILDMGKNIEIEGDYMFMFWIKPNHVSTNYVCAGSGSSNYLRIGSATNFFFKSNNVNKSLDLGVSGDGTSIGIAQWHHFAMTRNNGTLKVYFDNIAQDSSASDTAKLTLQYIGARGGASLASHYYDGMIDEFFVYDNFDANTISKNYKHGKNKHKN